MPSTLSIRRLKRIERRHRQRQRHKNHLKKASLTRVISTHAGNDEQRKTRLLNYHVILSTWILCSALYFAYATLIELVSYGRLVRTTFCRMH